MSDHEYLRGVSPDQLAALVFELAAQLHVERTERLALQTALERAGVIAPGATQALADDAALLGSARDQLDRSVRALLRIVTEAGDAKAPLRPEALESVK
jgi:hypothetical protein